ncbi:uncharacterized protein LOC118784005 [Megalops cyprinoides]|uniref:uncharacterized protein LOC118784005 n=1 Tax=Megalops cyprinoides TaxID=118141 RepID=UPI0018643B74|nr:uncharacterized protein LOC118784005 [Megalops cyprinoides]
MAYTFKSDDHMVITIPLSSIGKEEELLPENFSCVFKDVYKVFLQGQPKALGTSQLITGVMVICLGLLVTQEDMFHLAYTLPSVLFIVSGMLSYAAGHSPDMCVTKLSFSLNIISFFWAIVALVMCCLHIFALVGVQGLTASLLVLEMGVAVVLIYWESKAVCREHFNILPVINLKLDM